MTPHNFRIPGLSEEENDFIFTHLISPLKNEGYKIYLFGSRATKNHKKFSDIDLLYITNNTENSPSDRKVYKLITAIENSKFPYKIDFVNLKDLATSYRLKVDAEKIELT